MHSHPRKVGDPGESTKQRNRALRRRAVKAMAGAVAAGVEPYDRARHLPRLIPVEPDRLADGSPENRRRIVAALARALRAERNRGRAGHWTYDLNRHIGLKQAYAAERRLVAKGEKPAMPTEKNRSAEEGGA
jgi:Family of unknown function (DUF6477)